MAVTAVDGGVTPGGSLRVTRVTAVRLVVALVRKVLFAPPGQTGCVPVDAG